MVFLQGLSYQVIIKLKHLLITQNIHIFVTDNIIVVFFFFTECNISDKRALQLKQWLRNNSQPLSQVQTYMQDTAVYRARCIRDKNWTIDEILKEFPHLLTKGMVSLGKYYFIIDVVEFF